MCLAWHTIVYIYIDEAAEASNEINKNNKRADVACVQPEISGGEQVRTDETAEVREVRQGHNQRSIILKSRL